MVNIINTSWDKRFAKYFPKNDGKDWKALLEEFHQIRNPIMHANGHLIPKEVLKQVVESCQCICGL